VKKDKTEIVKYPCPKCGTYSKPFMHNRDGIAYMLCKKCNIQYKTSCRVSANFRKFCQKLGSKPNRTQGYYTSSEIKIKKYLNHLGLIEGKDYIHNCRFKNIHNNCYYWVDFYLPFEKLIVEASPSVWHKMWGREKSDKKKVIYLTSLNLTVIILNEKDIASIDLRKKVKCEKLDHIFYKE